ncbi:MAG: phage terminase large subunit family protein [Deltaproteobacteria bacterium]|nr:phage terminase large subunit family protein [Deltaproteobacteria bacterium]
MPQIEEIKQDSLFVTCEWFPSERRLLIPPEEISTSEWAERHRYVVKSTKPGPWRNINNPALVGIMNAADRRGPFRRMRALVVQKGVQTGVTDCAHNILFRRMDGRSHNAMVVMESERKIRRVFKQRIITGIQRSGRLSAQLSANPDDTTNYSIIMASGFCLNAGWGGSQSAVASDPCETVILDEVDKYDTPMNIEEAKDRITTYSETGLAMIFSTPGLDGGPITAEMASCDAVFDYHAACPDCGHLQPMIFDNFWWPDKGAPLKPGAWKKFANRIQREKSARYACGACGSLWDDYARDRAVLAGLAHNFHGWRMREDVDGPVSAGFYFPSWLSPFKSLSDISGRWLRAQEPGHPDKLRAWYNNEAAEPFTEGEAGINAAEIYDRREAYAAEAPQGVLLLTIGGDVQRNRVELEVKGWGPAEESWGIEHKIIQGAFVEEKVQDALDDFIFKPRRHESGALMQIARAALDSGYYTSQVYAYCKAREGRGVYAVKGSSDTRADILDGRLARRKDAVFQKIGVTACKDILFGRLALTAPGPGFMHFPLSYDMEYFHQLTAERISKSKSGRRLYERISGRPNEAIDLNNYNLAALRMYNPDWEALRRGMGGADKTRLIYKNHGRHKHLDEAITLKPEYPIVLCCDFNRNPLVWPLCQTDGQKVWCFDEINIRNATTMDMGMEALRRHGGHKKGFIVYGSASGTLRSPAGKSEYAILKDLGFFRQAVKLTNPLPSDRINAVNNMLENMAGLSRLSYNSNCAMLKKDFEQAIWLEDMSEMDRTDYGRGNAADALGFFIAYEWPLRAANPDPAKRFYK